MFRSHGEMLQSTAPAELSTGQWAKGPPSGRACLLIFPAEALQTGAPCPDAEPRLPEDDAMVVLCHGVRGSLVSQ